MRSRLAAIPLGGALLAVLCLGAAAARAGDVAPSLTVDYNPPRLSVEARGVSLARVLAEIGRMVGFSIVDLGNSSDPLSISVHAASVNEVLRQLLQRENHTVLYLAGGGAEPGSPHGIDRIILLGAPVRMGAAADPRDPRLAAGRPAATGGERPPTGFPSTGPLPSMAESARLSPWDRQSPDGPTDRDSAPVVLEDLLRTHAMAGAQTNRGVADSAPGPRDFAPPTDLEAALAETTRRAQQGLAALVEGLATATRSLQESAAAGRR